MRQSRPHPDLGRFGVQPDRQPETKKPPVPRGRHRPGKSTARSSKYEIKDQDHLKDRADASRTPPRVTETPSPPPWRATAVAIPSGSDANPLPEERSPSETANGHFTRSASRKFARDVAIQMGGGGGAPRMRKPYFCALAFTACCGVFLGEVGENGWAFQPLTCPAVCDGVPCHNDGTACESNLLLGPAIAVMHRLGAKDDGAIFDEGEWWRLVSCNWLHAGVLHLLFNMMALGGLGAPLERKFGTWRLATLYVTSGLFGTVVSVIFLPNVISVGASASVFGLVGACWADVFINHFGRHKWPPSFFALLVATALNLAIGLTPWVDNFMHLGGFVAGLLAGMSLFAKRGPGAAGERKYTQTQRVIVAISAVLLSALVALAVAAGTSYSSAARSALRSCSFCKHINCVEISLFTEQPWWSCCVPQGSGGQCQLRETDGGATIAAACNMTDGAFERTCNATLDEGCGYDPTDSGSINALCARLCYDTVC